MPSDPLEPDAAELEPLWGFVFIPDLDRGGGVLASGGSKFPRVADAWGFTMLAISRPAAQSAEPKNQISVFVPWKAVV